MDSSVMLGGLIVVSTSAVFFILMTAYRCLPDRVKVVLQLENWSVACVLGWLVGMWIFAIGYLIL